MSVQAIDKRTESETALAGAFESMKDKGAAALRREAWESFARQGLPTRRVEAWHYTDLRAALRVVAPIGAPAKIAAPIEGQSDRIRLVLADGEFRPELSDMSSLPPGVEVLSLRAALSREDAELVAALAPDERAGADAVVALNAALMQDGVVVRIAPGVQLSKTLELAILSSGGPAHGVYTRSLIVAGDGSKARIVEASRALEPSGVQENHVLAFAIGSGCEIEHIADVSSQSDDAIRLYSLLVSLAARSAFTSLAVIAGGGLIRRQIFARLTGEYSSVAFDGLSLLRSRDHADTTLVVEHAAPHCKSRERFRTVLDGQATGVFQGKAVVRPGAQKTDGAMQSKALLLSDGATMNNKPELEIFADDVVCGHGATCGRLDADQLFYLEARGLPKYEAEALLIEGFANEVIDAVADEATREAFQTRIHAWLGRREDGR